MRERVEKIGGSLDVWSKPGFGTEIVVSIPAAIAYAPSSARGVRAVHFGSPIDRTDPVPPTNENRVGQPD
jgi:chemotaxis protein histidine kinase CheA